MCMCIFNFFFSVLLLYGSFSIIQTSFEPTDPVGEFGYNDSHTFSPSNFPLQPLIGTIQCNKYFKFQRCSFMHKVLLSKHYIFTWKKFLIDYYGSLPFDAQTQILSFCHVLTNTLHQCTYGPQNGQSGQEMMACQTSTEEHHNSQSKYNPVEVNNLIDTMFFNYTFFILSD